MKLTFPSALFLLFLGLKLTAVINWSWWWVTCPLWALPAIIFSGLIMVFIGAVMTAIATNR